MHNSLTSRMKQRNGTGLADFFSFSFWQRIPSWRYTLHAEDRDSVTKQLVKRIIREEVIYDKDDERGQRRGTQPTFEERLTVFAVRHSMSSRLCFTFEKSKSAPVARRNMSSTSKHVVSKWLVASYDFDKNI